MIKIETLTKIVNDLWQDEDIDRLVVRLKWEDMVCQKVLDCRDAIALNSAQVECVINDAITDMLLNIIKEAENRFTGPIEIGPIKYVRITTAFLDPKIIECHATLQSGIVPQFKEEKND